MSHRLGTSRSCLAWACLMILMINAISHAQDGPVLVAEHAEYDRFGIYNIQSSAELLYHYQFNENNTNTSHTTFTENRFQEIYNISASSHIIHPNLVAMTMSGGFGLSQDSSSTQDTNTSTDSQSNSIVQSYNLAATILRKEYMPISLYAQRTTAQVSNQFSSSQETTTTVYGGNLAINSQSIPTRITYQHSLYEQTDPVGNSGFTIDQDTFTWHSDMQPAHNQRLNFDYTFNSSKQTSASLSQAANQSNDISAGHNIIFGKRDQYNLNSSFNYSQLQGTFEQTHFNWNESLDMQWSETLDSSLLYNYTHDEQSNLEQDTHRLTGRIKHKLYKSLTTTVRAGAVARENNAGDTSFQKFVNLNLAYRKKVPYGSINVGLSLTYDQEDSNSQGSTTFISGDTYTYIAPSSILVNHRNIVAGSVRVYNASFFVYTEGLDYTLIYATDSMLVTIPLGSNITNGQTIYLDYTTQTEPSNTTTTIGQGINFRYNIDEGWLKGLSVYANFFTSQQTIDSSEPTFFTPDQTTDMTFGADYHIWKLNFQGRHHIHDSNVSPYNTTNFVINYHDRISRQTALDLSVSYDESNYTLQNEQTTNWLFNGSFSQQLGQNLFGSLTMGYQMGESSTSGPRDAFDQSFTLNWLYRQTSVFVTGRNAFIQSRSQDSLSQSLEIGIRRTF